MIDNCPIEFTDDIKYLGVFIHAGNKFSCTLDHVKMSFYRAFNALLYRCKNAKSEMVPVYLLKAFCIPLLTYSIESISPSKSYLHVRDQVINRAVGKIFNTFDADNNMCIRSMVGLYSARRLYIERTCQMLLSYFNVNSSLLCLLRRLNFQWLAPLFHEFSITDDCPDRLSLQRLLVAVSNM